MLTTTEAGIHIGCQFALKRGAFLLATREDTDEGVRMTLTPVSGEGANVVIDVMADSLDTPMWNLTLCNGGH